MRCFSSPRNVTYSWVFADFTGRFMIALQFLQRAAEDLPTIPRQILQQVVAEFPPGRFRELESLPPSTTIPFSYSSLVFHRSSCGRNLVDQVRDNFRNFTDKWFCAVSLG